MIDALKTQYERVCATAGADPGAAEMTVVFDAWQNSGANFTRLAGAGPALHRVSARVGPDRAARLQAHRGRRRRLVLTPESAAAQRPS